MNQRHNRDDYGQRKFVDDDKGVKTGQSFMPPVLIVLYVVLYPFLLIYYTPSRIDAAVSIGLEKIMTMLALLTVCFVLLSILIAYRLIQNAQKEKWSRRSLVALPLFLCAALPVIGHVHDVASYCFFLYDYDLMASQKTRETKEWPTATAMVFWQDGKMGVAEEILFERDQTRTIDRNLLPVSDDIARLPDLTSRGYLYSLHQSMVRDESGQLKRLVEQFVVEADPTARRDLLDRMVLTWSDVSDVGVTPNTGQRAFMDKHFGEPTLPTVLVAWQQSSVDSAYNAVTQYLYGQLLLQTHYKDLIGRCHQKVAYLDVNEALEEIAKGYAADPERTKKSMTDFFITVRVARFLDYLLDNDSPIHADKGMLSSYGAELPEVYEACLLIVQHRVGAFSTPRFGTQNVDTLNGSNVADILVGLDGNDTLRGDMRDDILIGGRGDDVYIWNPGDGDDTIIDANVDAESNVLRIGKGASRGKAVFKTVADGFILTIGETGEHITLRTTSPDSPAAMVEFADET